MSAPAPPPAYQIPFARDMSGPWAFLFCFLPVLLGLGVAVAAHFAIILPRMGTGSADLNRMIAFGHRLDKGFKDQPTMVFIGDSVTVEGIDAALVAKAGPPGWRVLNFAVNGYGRAALDVVVPKIAASKPDAVCLVLRPLSIAQPPDLLVAYAYNLGGFPAAFPPNWIHKDTPGIPPEYLAMLQAPPLEAKIHFRTALQQVINEGLRAHLRQGVRDAASDDWNAPYDMTASIAGSQLDSNIAGLEKELSDCTVGGTARHEQDLERLIAHLHGAGVQLILISAPIHPRLRESFGPTAARLTQLTKEWESKYNAIYADASLLLDESGFADGQHPNEKGRALLSAFVGQRGMSRLPKITK